MSAALDGPAAAGPNPGPGPQLLAVLDDGSKYPRPAGVRSQAIATLARLLPGYAPGRRV